MDPEPQPKSPTRTRTSAAGAGGARPRTPRAGASRVPGASPAGKQVPLAVEPQLDDPVLGVETALAGAVLTAKPETVTALEPASVAEAEDVAAESSAKESPATESSATGSPATESPVVDEAAPAEPVGVAASEALAEAEPVVPAKPARKRSPKAKPADAPLGTPSIDAASAEPEIVDLFSLAPALVGEELDESPVAPPIHVPARPVREDHAEAASEGSEPEAAHAVRALPDIHPAAGEIAMSMHGLTKKFGGRAAVDNVDLDIPVGSFYGFVGPNGAGKTTTLAMVTGMLRPDAGTVTLGGHDIWKDARVAKRQLGVLPDRLRLFDRLTGAEFLTHAGRLRGLSKAVIRDRTADLAAALGFEHSLDRLVTDYSAGMVKKISIAAAMIHAPRMLVLDEPFESVDPVSAARITDILTQYTSAGGTVLLSSHSMGLIESVCDHVAIIVDGRMLAAGPMAAVVKGSTLEKRFVELAGGEGAVEDMEWLQTFSD